ncbi:MAG: hypothetical protein Q4P18_07160 [Methanobrevibacter sp.]|uniref:hypothetical protein n=1 Tax=Methanobrevibacter sp. TaxID=66852 RepID=UPI0026DF2CD3|nr:hypothetical protein [Methanobrevibacter sp.]MDO5849296.1 hypothetical protein [Methanobrevibacter sp.]
MEDLNLKGNITTIVKFAVMTIAPYLSISETTSNQYIAVIVAAIGLILAYFDSRYDNTLINQPNLETVALKQEILTPPVELSSISDESTPEEQGVDEDGA